MTAPHDLDRQLSAFLDEGPTELPDPSFDAVRDQIETMRQRVFIGPWRFPEMNRFVAAGIGTAAVVLALLVGSRLLGPPASTGVGVQPAATPSASPTMTPSPSASTPSPTPVPGLPMGPFTVVDVQGPDAAVHFTVGIPTSGWISQPQYGSIEKGTEANNLPEATILFWSWPVGTRFDVYGDPCHWATTRPKTPATTVAKIANALAAQASRDASKPVDVTVGGSSGKHVTLRVPNDAASLSGCDRGDFASYGVAGASEPERYHQGPGQIDELWLLDVSGRFAIIDAMYRPDTPPTLIDEMRAIASSTTFE
jgi:hypothetical protein